MRGCILAMVAALGGLGSVAEAAEPAARTGYAVVVSRQTHDDPAWRSVVDALVAKHPGATVLVYEKQPEEVLPALRKQFPRFACFAAKPTEATREFVARVHRLTRRLDDDPYTDVVWGILTGFDAANALKIAKQTEPLTVRRVASGTEVALNACAEGVWYCELVKNRAVRKAKDGRPEVSRGPDDTTRALADTLTDYRADLFVTSGHATERDWQIGYRYRNGTFRSKAGQLYGRDTAGRTFDIYSPNPKVYLPIGNCLMGHIDGPDAMALAWMNSAGVHQMMGYTVVTWYGYGGWGCLDYFVEQPGRYTFAEAFHVNHQALLHRLHTLFPEMAAQTPAPGAMRGVRVVCGAQARAAGLGPNDGRGLLFDRDVVAFYGDPAWQARMADGPKHYEQSLSHRDGEYRLTITPNKGADSFKPVNTNGAQRGWRPIVQLLPHRVGDVELIEGGDLNPVITDTFILVPNPRQCDPDRPYRVVFRAKPL